MEKEIKLKNRSKIIIVDGKEGDEIKGFSTDILDYYNHGREKKVVD